MRLESEGISTFSKNLYLFYIINVVVIWFNVSANSCSMQYDTLPKATETRLVHSIWQIHRSADQQPGRHLLDNYISPNFYLNVSKELLWYADNVTFRAGNTTEIYSNNFNLDVSQCPNATLAVPGSKLVDFVCFIPYLL